VALVALIARQLVLRQPSLDSGELLERAGAGTEPVAGLSRLGERAVAVAVRSHERLGEDEAQLVRPRLLVGMRREDGRRVLGEGGGFLRLVDREVQVGEVAEAHPHLGMVGAQRLLADRKAALVPVSTVTVYFATDNGRVARRG
jgi:hypothetical protein